jgi:predicted nucleic acid-binding protein
VIVPDASAVIALLLRVSAGGPLERRILGARALGVPHVLDLEVVQVLRRYVREREMSEERAGEAIEDLRDLPLERYPHEPLIPRIWELRKNATAYDAAYLVLAEALGATFITLDRRLAAVPGSHAEVEVFA